jgi:hypothetical protein
LPDKEANSTTYVGPVGSVGAEPPPPPPPQVIRKKDNTIIIDLILLEFNGIDWTVGKEN